MIQSFFIRGLLSLLVFLGSVKCSSSCDLERDLFVPVRLALADIPSIPEGSYRSFQLTPESPVATLDYGQEVAGYPVFEISTLKGLVQIEVKYSEEAAGLEHDFSDGPFPFNVALSNTFRVETFEIKEVGCVEAFLLQGGQRWQSIKLITDGEVSFSSVGFVPTVEIKDADNLPGSFSCDDETLNDIWKLGARAASLSCVEAGTQRAIWEVDPEDGAYIRGMRPAVASTGAFFANYTLEFETKIDKGGIGWVVAFPLASPMQGVQLNIVADHQALANFNRTLMRPNSVLLGYGYSFVNVTTLPSWHLETFDVPFRVQHNVWYNVRTILGDNSLSVWINDVEVFKVGLGDYAFLPTRLPGGSIAPQGSFGFGGWQDQAGHFRRVVVRDTANGTELYRNSLMDDSALREFGVQANYESVCLDGPKRDRLVWLGDLLHTVRIVAASTSRFDLLRGSLRLFLDWQTPSGLLPYAPPLGYDPKTSSNAFARGGGAYFMGAEVYGVILVDYQILGVLSFTDYIRLSNDLEFAQETWTHWISNIEYLTAQVNTTTGLLSITGAFLGPSKAGSAINCALAQAYHEMADVAAALGKDSVSRHYAELADEMASAVNSKLWNEQSGFYGNALSDFNGTSVSSTAFCITSGIATDEQAMRSVLALESLRLGPGYKDSSSSNSSDSSVKISPNTNGFLLSALLAQNSSAISTASMSLELIKSLWTPMLSDDTTFSGASWEYVSQQGVPGLGLYTSLSHPWGGAPTYLLPQWVTGIQTAPGARGFGYEKWTINPTVGVNMGIKRSKAKIQTTRGKLAVGWVVKDGFIHVKILAPKGTTGDFKLGSTMKALSGAECYHFQVSL